MMKLLKEYNTNDELKNTIQSLRQNLPYIDYNELDDEQLAKVTKYFNLSIFEQDLLLLTSNLSIVKVANLYNCSRGYIYRKIKQIMSKL